MPGASLTQLYGNGPTCDGGISNSPIIARTALRIMLRWPGSAFQIRFPRQMISTSAPASCSSAADLQALWPRPITATRFPR